MRPLSDKIHVALKQAVYDLQAVRQMPDYKIQMYGWHQYTKFDDKCAVCLAGATIVRRTDCERWETVLPLDFEEPLRNKLIALNDLLAGSISSAVMCWGRAIEKEVRLIRKKLPDWIHAGPTIWVNNNTTDEQFREWKEWMFRLSDWLKKNVRYE